MPNPSQNVLNLRVPESIFPRLQQVLPEKEYKKNLHSYLWPFHLINEKMANNVDIVFNKHEGYVFLHSENDIRKIIGTKPIIKTLKSAGLIHCKLSQRGKERYFTKEKGEDASETKLYALNEGYYLDELVEYPVVNRKFLERVYRSPTREEYQPKTKLERYLKKSFKHFELDPYIWTFCELKRSLTILRQAVDKTRTTDHKQLSKTIPHLINAIEERGHTVMQVLNELSCIASYKKGRYATDLLQIEQFESGEIFFLRAENGERIFNTANLMPRYIRRFIQHKGGLKLFEADIRNCQPLMLCGLLNRAYRRKWTPDMFQYKSLCEEGKFYEYLHMLIYGVELMEVEEDKRTEFKKDLFRYVYYGRVPSPTTNNKFVLAFEKAFPNVFAFINDYKTKHNYKALSTEMQREESRVVINTVCAELMESKSVVITIHDGLLVTEDETERAESLLRVAFYEMRELKPDIKIKPIIPHDISLYKRFDYLTGAIKGEV